eukprot:1147622_1
MSEAKGGFMHFYINEHNFFGGQGIVGAQVPERTGLAFANKDLTAPGFIDATPTGLPTRAKSWSPPTCLVPGSFPWSSASRTINTEWTFPSNTTPPILTTSRSATMYPAYVST